MRAIIMRVLGINAIPPEKYGSRILNLTFGEPCVGVYVVSLHLKSCEDWMALTIYNDCMCVNQIRYIIFSVVLQWAASMHRPPINILSQQNLCV